MLDFNELTLTRAAAGLASGDWTAQELADACLQRIERFDQEIVAFISVTPPAPGPIPGGMTGVAGIPLAVKDLFETAGVRTTHGCLFFKDYLPTQDAAVIQKLKSAGAVLLGKLNMHEIALGVTGENPHFGVCHNPWDLSRISGGSSSGSAAAVAAGLCLGALGSDTGGSIRIPASLCGVVGLKPTYGRVSLRGVLPLSWNLDHVGPLARCVRDAAVLLQVIAGYDPDDPFSIDRPVDDYLAHLEEGVHGWRILALDDPYTREADEAVLATLERAAGMLGNLGAQVTRQPAEPLELRLMAEANLVIVLSDAAAYHQERLRDSERFGADVCQRLQQGAETSLGDYIRARRFQAESRRRMERLFREIDLLVLPATPTQAPPIGVTNPAGRARSLTRFTAPFNLTGLPALSLPMGLANGLPTAVQLVAAPWAEGRLLQAARALEQAAGKMPLPPTFN